MVEDRREFLSKASGRLTCACYDVTRVPDGLWGATRLFDDWRKLPEGYSGKESLATSPRPREIKYGVPEFPPGISTLFELLDLFQNETKSGASRRCLRPLHSTRLDSPANLCLGYILGHLKIIASLQIHPKSRSHPEISRQAKRHDRSDCTFRIHDLIDRPRINAKMTSHLILAQAHRFINSSKRISPGCIGGNFFIFCSPFWSMIVTYFHIVALLSSPQTKQTRYWSLIRMPCWPLLFPLRASRRLPGGLRRLSITSAASSISAFYKRPVLFRGNVSRVRG